MTNPQLALAVFVVLSLGASAAFVLCFGWPANEKVRPEDFASEQDFVDYLSSAGRVDKRYEDR